MRKKNQLYTANKWNQPLFARGMDRRHGNILDGMFESSLNTSLGNDGFRLSKPPAWYTTPQLTQPKMQIPTDWSNPVQANAALESNKNLIDNFDAEADKSNPFKQILGGSGGSGGSNFNIGSLKGAAGAIGGVLGGVANNLISGGYSSGAGSAISGIGSQLGSAISTVNPLIGGIVSLGSGVVGGLTNAAFGMKTDQKALNDDNKAIDYYGSYNSNASSFDDVTGPTNMGSFKNVYKGGWFSGGKARRKNEALRKEFEQKESFANRSVDNNINNIADTQMDNLELNYAAFGGPLFALGGDIQSNGSDFTTGLTEINAGGSHEENPYQGVQVGISRKNGQPNLVEEGETIFDDYVFSKRIMADEQTKKKFHIGKKRNISYADLSKKLQKESLERPNDAISQQGLTKQLHELAEEQERQKSEQQAQQAQALFESLPPEQQAEIMQQIALQEQQGQQAGQQAMEESQMQEASSPEQPMTENPMQEQPMEQEGMNGEQMNACGGKLNRYADGGDMKRNIYKHIGNIHTDSDFDKWATDHKIDKVTDWDNILKNEPFMKALKESNPAFADALSRGYDFGAYTYTPDNKLTFDFKHGGWGLEDYNAWDGSNDAAWKEAVKKGLVKKGMNSEEIGKALMQTDSYRRGSDWLKASDANRLTYLQAILNSEDAPQAARDYAARYVDKNGWLKNAKTDYQTIFEDPNGTGVRNTHPGTYWKTPDEVLRNKVSTNYLINNDGTVEEIYGDVPKEWTQIDNFNWSDAKGDYGASYFRKPATTPDGKPVETEEEMVPVHKPTWGRSIGLAGPLVGLGMQAMGIGKPNYSGIDASLAIGNGAPALAKYKPIGDYLTYKPMDIWYEQNRLNANSRATDRAILNSSSPLGAKTAGLLANGYNSQIASGELYRKALEYNDAQKQKVGEFNRGTNMFNAEAANRVSATNAEIQNRNRQFRAQMAMDAARQRMAADAAWNQGIYGNVQSLFKGLGDWGKENAQHNMIADMAADGLFGTMSDKQNIGKGYLVKKAKKARGGRLNRKRGLTF